jgi:hypothetical protein
MTVLLVDVPKIEVKIGEGGQSIMA